jgi:hypothetical protein
MSDEAVVKKAPTHSINLSVMVDNSEDWRDVFSEFTSVAGDLDKAYAGVTVTSYDLSSSPKDDSEEYYDEYTMLKVHKAITECAFTDHTATDIISALQNAGILFRERR